MITTPEVRTNIYGAFYRVIRIGQLPTVEQFYQMTVAESWPKNQPSPADFPDFWWEAVALEIQNGFIARKAYLNNLNSKMLKDHMDHKWQVFLDYAVKMVEKLN